jgi:glycosyltransferase involved in cell wall biosynthesis
LLMKIAVVGPAYPFRGGIAHYTTLLAAQLADEHETRLYSFRRQYPAILFPGRSQIDPSLAPLAEVETRRWLTPWWPWSWQCVNGDWKTWLPDRVVVQWWVPFMAPMTAWLLDRARRLGIHSTLICHNVLPHEQSRVDRAVVRWALQRADRLVVHTTAQQALAQHLIPGCCTSVVPLPSYAAFHSDAWTRERAREQLGLDGNVLLFFGLVRPYKGLQDLIEALPAVLREIDATLLVVGEVWGDAMAYQSRVAQLGLQANVQFVDRYVSNEEAAMYFAAADLAVLPYREATGSAVLQLAFGLGVPVVATRTGGMDEVVEDGVTGFLFEPGDVNGLRQAIVRFFHQGQSPLFRQNILDHQSRFSWQRLIEAIIAETPRG